MSNEISVSGRRILRREKKKIERLARAVLRELGQEGVRLDVFLLFGDGMVQLKKKFGAGALKKRRNAARWDTRHAKPVDVLAFPAPRSFPHPETRRMPLGEIYLNRDLVRRNPSRRAFLLIHGTLHLLGYLHSRPKDALRMERKERTLWRHVSSLV